ncbi:MAG: type II secretion system protein [Patescibacteria group bacterium]
MKKFNKGFTLIELLVVIAIIGILSSIVLASLSSARTKGDDAAISSSMANMRSQAELYYANNSSTYGTVAATCDDGMFNATTTGGLDKLVESVKTKAGASNVSCVASSTGWAVGAKLKGSGTFCVDGKGVTKASSSLTTASSAYSASLGACL